MYRILIVDDEKVERNGIKFLLKRTGIDCEVKEAFNGQTALDMVKEESFDILLTDVKMPYMDGIELIETISKLEIPMKYVIFSGCSEFKYAKQAMKLGVVDYILKPVDPDEFKNTMNRVISSLEEKKADNELKSKSIEYMCEHMIYMLVNGMSIDEVITYNNNMFTLDFLNEFRRMMLIEFNKDFFGIKGSDFNASIMAKYPEAVRYLNLNAQQSLVFFNSETLDYIFTAKHIYDDVKNVYNEKCYIAISDAMNGYEDIPKNIDMLEEIIDNKFYNPGCSVFYNGMAETTDDIVQLDDDSLMKQMKQDIKLKDVRNLRDHFRRFCVKYQKKTDFSQVYIKFLFSNLLKEFVEVLPEEDEKSLNEEIDELYRASEFETVMSIVNSNIDKIEKVFSQNTQMLHREIEVVKKYIYEHYGDEISVDQLSEMVYMAPSYLSSVFKKETGQNLSKYIKSFRMEKAKDMLENSMLKIVEISTACGYPNASYFCSSFREYFGISPQKFRENSDEVQ